MGSTRPGHRASRSLSGIRTAFAALVMPPPAIAAADFNTMADFSPRLRFCKRVNSTSIIPTKAPGFESQEPTSPKVTCTGQVRRKPQWAKAAKQEKATAPIKPAKDTSNYTKKLYKLKKLMLGRHHNSNNNNRATEDDEKVQVEEGKCNISLGAMKHYTSGSYDAKFGSMFVEDSQSSLI